MATSPSRPMTIGDFLLRRLKEAGVRHLFGVPRDDNLELLQQLRETRVLEWVGNWTPESLSRYARAWNASACCSALRLNPLPAAKSSSARN
jgi:TPP-dependent 2-oxoacid decarboxylase